MTRKSKTAPEIEDYLARMERMEREPTARGRADDAPDEALVEVDWTAFSEAVAEQAEASGSEHGSDQSTALEAAMAAIAPPSALLPMDHARRYFGSPDDLIKFMEPRVALVKMGAGATRVVTRDATGLAVRSVADFRAFYESVRVEVDMGVDKNGKPVSKIVAAMPVFLTSDAVRLYDAMECNPRGEVAPHVLNFWEGLRARPEPGDWSKLGRHILQGICGGDEALAGVLLDWMAHMVQRPWEKPGFAIVVQGTKGIGKSTLFMFLLDMIGPKHSIKVANSEHLFGKFNAHRLWMLFTLVEEALWAGSKREEGQVKDLITAETQLVERKGVDAGAQDSFERFGFVSNEAFVVPAGADERRFLVLKAADPCAGAAPKDRAAYFTALHEEWRGGGREAFLAHLIERDISTFNRFSPPKTEGLIEQIEHGLSDAERWVQGILSEGIFTLRDGTPLSEAWELDEGLFVETAIISQSFESHVRRHGGSSAGPVAALRALKAYARPEGMQRGRRPVGNRAYGYSLGTRREWRERFTERLGIAFEEDIPEGGGVVLPLRPRRRR